MRRAIHAVSVYQLPWQPCSDILNYTLNTPISMVAVHERLIAAGLVGQPLAWDCLWSTCAHIFLSWWAWYAVSAVTGTR